MSITSSQVEFVDLGRIDYASAYKRQIATVDRVLEWRQRGDERAGVIYMLEHDPPVITISRRPDARKHLLADDAQLAAAGVTVAETDRGGDITYHGPGQLVVYPIIDLNRFGLNLHGYMRLLEQVVIDVLNEVGIDAGRDDGATGVWTGQAKICAIGVRVRRWISMHGMALNVTTDLSHFDLIVPCGLAGRAVTSIARETNRGDHEIGGVKESVARRFAERLADLASAPKATPTEGLPSRRR